MRPDLTRRTTERRPFAAPAPRWPERSTALPAALPAAKERRAPARRGIRLAPGLAALLLAGCSSGAGGSAAGGDGGTASAALSGQLKVFQAGTASTPAAAPPSWLQQAADRLLAARAGGHGGLRGQSQPLAPAAAPADDEMVPGQLLLGLREDGGAELSRLEQVTAALGYRLQPRAWASDSLVCVELIDAADPTRPVDRSHTLLVRERLAGDRALRSVEPNYLRHVHAVPDDPLYKVQWHYPQLNLPAAWDVTTGAPGVIVAFVDDGVSQHPDLVDRLLPGYDMISDPAIAGDGDGRDPDPSEVPGTVGGRSVWHGTHVSGTIGASSNNGQGVAGVDWQCRLVPVRALGIGGGTSIDILAAINWAAGIAVPGAPANANPAQVINMSIGGGGLSQAEQDTINAVVARGVTLVVSAGNDNRDATGVSFAGYDNVIVVGALDFAARRSPYSNFGAVVDVVAPGGNEQADLNADGLPDGVGSTYRDQAGNFDYELLEGTSMAAPHVTGVVALMKSVAPALTPAAIEQILKATANPASKCAEGCGAGLVNAAAAVLSAKGGGGAGAPQLSLSADRLNLADGPSAQLSVFNGGGGQLHFQAAIDGAAAASLKVTGGASGTLAAGGAAAVTVSANRSGLANGTYQASLLVTSDGGQARASLVFIVGAVAASDVGQVVVGAVQLDSSKNLIEGGEGSATLAGSYRYRFLSKPGNWYLVAIADRNGNNQLDQGDYWGFYRSLDNPVQLTVASSDQAGLDFGLVPYSANGSVSAPPCSDYRKCIEDCAGDAACQGRCQPDAGCTGCINDVIGPCDRANQCGGDVTCLCAHCSKVLDQCLGPLSCG